MTIKIFILHRSTILTFMKYYCQKDNTPVKKSHKWPTDQPLASDVFKIYFDRESILRCWSASTKKSYGMVRKTLDSFDRGLLICDLGKATLEDIYMSLVGKGLSNRTIKYYMSMIVTFIRWAEKNGYKVDRSYGGFSPRMKIAPKTVVWLNRDELAALFRLDRTGWTEHRSAVLDYFLMSCFTGLRVSDIANLKWSSIGDDGIHVVSGKTVAPLLIEMNSHTRELIGRQRKTAGTGDYLLPRIDMVNMNTVLKGIAREAGLDTPVVTVSYMAGGTREEATYPKYKLLSMHCGRRSFICNALSLGISPLIVMKWTGHKSYASIKPYIDISDSDKASAMSRFDLL